MTKKNMTEKQLANLKKGTKISEETARRYQEKSCITQRENTKKRKELESFSISSNKALAPIQATSLKDLAAKAQKILENEKSTPQEIKLAMEILEFLRDSSGQKPTDKQEIKNTTPQIIVATQTDADYLQKIADVKINKDVL